MSWPLSVGMGVEHLHGFHDAMVYVELFFPKFLLFFGRKPPCILARVTRGGMGGVMQVCLMHLLRRFILFWNSFWIFSNSLVVMLLI